MKRLLGLLLGLSMLASCVPVQDAAGGAINQTTGDAASIAPAQRSLVFAPAGEVKNVLVDIRGDALKSLDPKDNCIGDAQHLQCLLGDVSELTVIELTGLDVSAIVKYERAGELRLEVLTVPAP